MTPLSTESFSWEGEDAETTEYEGEQITARPMRRRVNTQGDSTTRMPESAIQLMNIRDTIQHPSILNQNTVQDPSQFVNVDERMVQWYQSANSQVGLFRQRLIRTREGMNEYWQVNSAVFINEVQQRDYSQYHSLHRNAYHHIGLALQEVENVTQALSNQAAVLQMNHEERLNMASRVNQQLIQLDNYHQRCNNMAQVYESMNNTDPAKYPTTPKYRMCNSSGSTV